MAGAGISFRLAASARLGAGGGITGSGARPLARSTSGGAAAGGSLGAGSQREDPMLGCRYLIEIDGLIVSGFSEVSGLEMQLETEELREGGRNDMVHALPVGTKYGTLVLTRGVTSSDLLWRWQSDVRNGQFVRRDVRIVLQDATGEEAWNWRCIEALPTKWTGPGLNAQQGEVAVERLELVHSGIRSG